MPTLRRRPRKWPSFFVLVFVRIPGPRQTSAKMKRCFILERRLRRVDMEFSRRTSLFAGMLRIGASANAR